jgi:hypothetical protein
VLPVVSNDLSVYVEEDCYFDVQTGVGTLYVSPGKSFTIAPNAILRVYSTVQLYSGATFVTHGTFMPSGKPYFTYIDTLASGRNWYLSSPVANWDLATAFAGNSTIDKEIEVLQTYNEPKHQWDKVSKAPAQGVGMVVQAKAATSGKPTYLNVMFKGELKLTDIAVPLTNTAGDKHGFNLIGNPFPSYWRFNASAVAAAGIYSTMWYRTYTPMLGYEFVAYNANGTVAAAPGWASASTAAELGFIPPMQAFWVRLQDGVASGTFTFDYASVSETGNGNRLRSAENTSSVIARNEAISDVANLNKVSNLVKVEGKVEGSDASILNAKDGEAESREDDDSSRLKNLASVAFSIEETTAPVIDVLVRLDVADVALTDADQLVIYSTAGAKAGYDAFDSEKMTDGSDLVRLYTYSANATTSSILNAKDGKAESREPILSDANLNKVSNQNLTGLGDLLGLEAAAATTPTALCIDGRQSIKVGDVIPLVFRAAWATPFMLRASELRGCGDIAVYLVDKLANKEFNLIGGGTYFFTSRSGEVTDRFFLEFRQAPVANETVATATVEPFQAWCSAPGTISVSGATDKNVEVYDLTGRLVFVSSKILNAKNATKESREDDDSLRLKNLAPFALSIKNITPGVYIVRCGRESVKVVVND